MSSTNAEKSIQGRLEQLQAACTKLNEALSSGLYAQMTAEIQTLQRIRHSKGWKLYLGGRAVLCALRERRLFRLAGSIVHKDTGEIRASLLREDWLRPVRKALEDGERALAENEAGLQQLIKDQQEAILKLIDAYQDAGKDAMVIMAPYFAPERLADGYFQRVQAIDRLLPTESLKIYASWLDADDVRGVPHVSIWDETHMEIRYLHPDAANDERIHHIALRAGTVYHHSMAFANELVTRDGAIRKAFDMHGAYPEELRMYGRSEQAELDEQQEKLAMEHGQCLICVTQSMVRHLTEKYGRIPETVILLPIFDDSRLQQCSGLKKIPCEKSEVVYAGGMQKWQNVKTMQDAVRRTEGRFRYRFYTPEPGAFWKAWGHRRRPRDTEVCSKTPDEVITAYASCDYGFLLRDDITVNRVACPTKLVEYLAAGIVPILLTANIGDFVQDGMAYISLDDFLSGKLPSEAEKDIFIRQNMEVVQKLKERYCQGKNALNTWLVTNENREGENG